MNPRKCNIILIHLFKKYLLGAHYVSCPGNSAVRKIRLSFKWSFFNVGPTGRPSPIMSRLSRSLSKVREQAEWLCGGRVFRAEETKKPRQDHMRHVVGMGRKFWG